MKTKLAPVTWLGWQETLEQPLALWILTTEIPDHPEGSTVSTQTLERAGFTVPTPPSRPPAEQAIRRHAWHMTRRSIDTANPFGRALA